MQKSSSWLKPLPFLSHPENAPSEKKSIKDKQKNVDKLPGLHP